MGGQLSNAHFVNSILGILSLLKAKVQWSDLELQGLGEPAAWVWDLRSQAGPHAEKGPTPGLMFCFRCHEILNNF